MDNIEITNNINNNLVNKNNPKILKENCCSSNIMDNGEIPNIFFNKINPAQNVNYFNINKIEIVENK